MPERNGEKKLREMSCADEVLHESVPAAARTMKTQRRGPHPALNHFFFPFFFIVGGEPPVTL